MKIKALTGSRAIAAIMVVIHHYAGGLYPFSRFGKLFTSGNIAVGYFFVLSGFVLSISQTRINTLTFLGKRLMRIAPAYIIALLLTVGIMVTYYPLPANFYRQIAYSAMFVHSFFPDYVLELNSPSWSVSVEMFFYLLFPLLFLLKKYKRWFITLTVCAYFSSQAVHLYYCNTVNPLSGSGIYFNPIIHLNEFMIGMAGGMIFNDYQSFFRHRWLTSALLIMAILLIAFRPEVVSYQAGLIAPLFMAFIVSVAVNGVSWLSTTAAVFMGEISYGIYIYQYPVFKLLGNLNTRYIHCSWGIAFYFCLAILILVSSASYYFIEKPLNLLFKKIA